MVVWACLCVGGASENFLLKTRYINSLFDWFFFFDWLSKMTSVCISIRKNSRISANIYLRSHIRAPLCWLAAAYGKMWSGYADVRTCKMWQNIADVKNPPGLVRVRNLPHGSIVVVGLWLVPVFKSSLVSHLYVLSSAFYPQPLAAINIVQSFKGNVQFSNVFRVCLWARNSLHAFWPPSSQFEH